MTNDNTHRPTPEFRDHLEWEVTRAFRRARAAEHRAPRRKLPWLRAAAVVIVSVALGATAGLASAQLRDGARRDSLLDGARAESALASLRLELARERLADVKRKVDIGVLSSTSLASAESELRTMEARAMRVRYDIEEIGAAAQAPRDDLNAPLVGGRDFVKDRIQLELVAAQQRLSVAESAQAEAQRRLRVGAGSELTRLEADAEVARASGAMGVLAERLKLRREFVEKGTPVDQLLRRLQEAELRLEAHVAQQALALARERVALLEKQRAVGVVEDLDVLKAQLEMKQLEIELRQLTLRQAALRLRASSRAVRDSLNQE